MSKRKNQICPENIGELFLKAGEDIPYRLVLCNTEPTAMMQRVDRVEPDEAFGISGLSGFVLLKPVVPRVRTKPEPKVRKPRADKGQKHQHKNEPKGRVCPTHNLPLRLYDKGWQCPDANCDYEEREG